MTSVNQKHVDSIPFLHEYELWRMRVVELVDDLASGFDAHGSVESDVEISPLPTKQLTQVQSLSVIRNEHHFIAVSRRFDVRQHEIQDLEFTGKNRLHLMEWINQIEFW